MKLGLVGCGAVASKFHLPAIRAIPEIRLEAIADIDSRHAKEFADRNGVNKVYSNHEEMLDDCSLDAILVCTPPTTHAQVVLDAIEKGRHVMCEKPFASGPEQAEKIAEQSGVVVFPAHNYVFTPALNMAREWHLENRLGELTSIHAKIGVGFWSWRSRTEYRTNEQSGVISDLLYHVVYVVNRLTRMRKILDTTVHRNKSGVTNRVCVKAKLEKSGEAVLSADWTSIIPGFQLLMNYERGDIGLDLMKRPYRIWGRENDRAIRTTPSVSRIGEIGLLMTRNHPSFVLEHTNFLRSVESKEHQQVTVQDAIETLRLLQEVKVMVAAE